MLYFEQFIKDECFELWKAYMIYNMGDCSLWSLLFYLKFPFVECAVSSKTSFKNLRIISSSKKCLYPIIYWFFGNFQDN